MFVPAEILQILHISSVFFPPSMASMPLECWTLKGDHMLENQVKPRSQTKTKLWIDIAIFVAFLIAMEPRSSGLPIHEWLTLSMVAAIIVHLLLSWDWIAQITRRFLGRVAGVSRLNYILNWLMFIDGILIMVSGIMISEAAMPALGISLPRNFAWRSLHDMSANFFLLLLGVHSALHWGWIVNAFKRYIITPLGGIFSSKSKQKDVTA
jgi:hypothetical protein